MSDDARELIDSDSKLGAALLEAKLAKDELAAAQARSDKAMAKAIELFTAGQRVTVSATTRDINATLVTSETVHIDTKELHDKLDDDQWERCTERVLNKELLEACVVAKVIPKEVVESCSEVVPRKPYILFKETRRPTIKRQPVKRLPKK